MKSQRFWLLVIFCPRHSTGGGEWR